MTDDLVSHFERGGSIEVPVAKIEAELSALWRAAAQQRNDKKPVTRACLWNFIVRAEGESDYQYAKQLIDEVSQRIPARVIVLKPEPSDEEGRISAHVEANWRRDGHGASGSDEVTLVATGRSVDRLVSLVRSLAITDVPSAMMWIGSPPAGGAAVRDLLKEIERLVVDSRKLPSEAGLPALARLAQTLPQLEMVDLSWLGVSPLRGLCASLFDQDATPLGKLTRVRVSSGVHGTQSRALLTLGWLGSLLGWRDYRRVESESAVRRWQATRRGGSVTIELATDSSGASHGVVGLELEVGGEKWSLGRTSSCIDVRGPGLPHRMQPARSHNDVDLTITALGPRGRDLVYRAALEHAAKLVES